jgi:hypothetical protein
MHQQGSPIVAGKPPIEDYVAQRTEVFSGESVQPDCFRLAYDLFRGFGTPIEIHMGLPLISNSAGHFP